MNKRGSSFIFLVILVFLLIISFVVGMSMIATQIQYRGYSEFCEDKDLEFGGIFEKPLCYEINKDNEIELISLGKIKGEIYIK